MKHRQLHKSPIMNRLTPALLVSSMATTTLAAPVTFNTALPVASGEFLAREQLIVNQSGNDPSGLNRDRTAKTSVTVLGYGVNRKLAVFGVLPYHDTELTLTTPTGKRITRRASGIGDATLFGRYTLLQRDERGKNFRLAVIAGVEAPTGADTRRDAIGLLPAAVQPGSGSWDPLFGVITTFQTLNYQIDTQLSHKINNEANGFDAGDVTRLDGSLQYRLWPRDLKGKVPGFLYGVLEANLIHQQKNAIGGAADPNSGGTRLFLTPGLQYVTRRWIIEAAIQLPMQQNLNGAALENDYIGRISAPFNF